jgi:hypothetical protein
METQPSKYCPRCKTDKPVGDYDFRSNSIYLRSYCRLCECARHKEWCVTNPVSAKKAQRKKDLKLNHGISEALYQNVFDEQDGLCAICGDQPSKRALAVDHDHITGKIRGLLCDQCNTALGKFKDSPELLLKAIAYLQKTHSVERDLPDSMRCT